MELLIVIVVIAILAAISIVAYTGIQNNANNAAARSSLRDNFNKIALYHAEHGSYPWGSTSEERTLALESLNLSITHSAFNASINTFIYCRSNNGERAALIGRVVGTNTTIGYTSHSGLREGFAWNSDGMHLRCADVLDIASQAVSGTPASGQWASWTGAN